jgi:hypothetical protein
MRGALGLWVRWLVATIGALVCGGAGCAGAEGCMGGDDGSCVPASACAKLEYACSEPSLALRIVEDGSQRPAGLAALGAAGDVVLENDRLIAVLDGVSTPHYLAPSGGSLLDLLPKGGSGDQLNQAYQAVGILPHDAARYHSLDLIDDRPRLVAAVFRGRLDLRPKIQIVTRYELRACEPGLRVRTEIYHGGRDPLSVMPSDAFFWGDRAAIPFVPLEERGFRHPELDLEKIGEALTRTPFVAAAAYGADGDGYAIVACGREHLSGFHDTTLSAVGLEPRILMPGDSVAFERFILAAPGPGTQRAVAEAQRARRLLTGARSVRVSGRVVVPGGGAVGGDQRRIGLVAYEAKGDKPAAPWAEAVPDQDGRFELWLPERRAFQLEAHVLGRALPERRSFVTTSTDLELEDLTVPELGTVEISVRDRQGAPLIAELVLTPAAPTNPSSVVGSVYGVFEDERCAPYLGPPHGGSPACNRVMVDGSGTATFIAPSGSYDVYATHGPFWTLARARIEVSPSLRATAALSLEPIDLMPGGWLSADLHVHGGASFDSNIPERDRVLGFVAADVQVIAATDHDVVTSYDQAIAELGVGDRVRVMPGVETTGQILFLMPPGAEIPKVIGHFNFWPLPHRPGEPRNGAPDDERLEPGELFDRMERLYDGVGVAQLNHPLDDESLGRDSGYLTAIGWTPRMPIPATAADTPAGQLRRRPGGGRSNLDFDAQEVMNGHSLEQYVRYRAAWFSLLSQGIVRAGTANSDSHGFGVEAVGYPRNLVFGGHALESFDRDRFNRDLRAGRSVGTNGPVIDACVVAHDGSCRGPSLEPLRPAPGAVVQLRVAAAPWIVVDQIRLIVNGQTVRTIPRSELLQPPDPFGNQPLRWDEQISLVELTARSAGDAWLVIEAGDALPALVDANGDGLPELVAKLDPPTRGAPQFLLDAIAPGTRSAAFTNPFLLDWDGDGFEPPGLPP